MTAVAQIVSPYLFHTGGWLYDQLTHIKKFQNVIFTHTTENLDQFPYSPIVSRRDLRPLERTIHDFVSRYSYRHFYWFYQPFVKKYEISIFHAHFGPEGVFAKPLCKAFPNIPLIVSFYGVDLSVFARKRYWQKAYREMFDRATMVVAEGTAMKKSLVKFGCPERKVIVQHLGVDVGKYRVLRRRPEKGKRLAVNVLHCASFREKKGHEYAIRAFAEAKKKFPNIILRLIGDGPLMAEMQALTSSLGVEKSVIFLGARTHEETLNEMKHAHLLLYPSVTADDGDTEGGAPFGIIEALATGLPVISSRHADIPEVVQHGKSGFLAEERNVGELTSYLDFFLSHPEQWTRFGEAGRSHIEKEYNMSIQSESLSKIYTQALKSVNHG
ncbi:MAG TPA: glycosyltransferase [Bacteroidota bacterium]|nr:glycosyltransferase [Bacteroidota bacterium]